MTKNCPLCNSTATDRDDTMYAKGGVCCDNMECSLNTVGIPADEWNSRPIEDEDIPKADSFTYSSRSAVLELDGEPICSIDFELVERISGWWVERHGVVITGDGSGEALPEVQTDPGWPEWLETINKENIERLVKEAEEKGIIVSVDDHEVTEEPHGDEPVKFVITSAPPVEPPPWFHLKTTPVYIRPWWKFWGKK